MAVPCPARCAPRPAPTRFSYCALNCLWLLDRLDAIDVDRAARYVAACKNFDGGFGCTPGNAGQIMCDGQEPAETQKGSCARGRGAVLGGLAADYLQHAAAVLFETRSLVWAVTPARLHVHAERPQRRPGRFECVLPLAGAKGGSGASREGARLEGVAYLHYHAAACETAMPAGNESHAGQVFTCVAALDIAGRLDLCDQDLLCWW
jgi:hypothetical protein